MCCFCLLVLLVFVRVCVELFAFLFMRAYMFAHVLVRGVFPWQQVQSWSIFGLTCLRVPKKASTIRFEAS